MVTATRTGLTEAQVRAILAEEIARVTEAAVGMTEEQVQGIVAAEIAAAIPDIVAAVRGEIDDRVAALQATMPVAGRARDFQYRDFSTCHPPEFKGAIDPIVSMRWLADVEGVFLTSGCPEALRVRFASNLLRDRAKSWWGTWTMSMTEDEIVAITWETFTAHFREEFVPQVEIDRVSREFLDLEQKKETIPEFNVKFRDMALLCPSYAADERMKMNRYLGALKTEIREFVCLSRYPTLAALMEAARMRELELETQARKRKEVQPATTTPTTGKKQKTGDSRYKNRGSNSSGGSSNRLELKCYKCNKSGHLARDCRSSLRVCFNCNQSGHVKADCPNPASGRAAGTVGAPAPATLRLTDGRTGTAKPQESRGRAYQLSAEDARVAPSVVAGIKSFYIYFSFLPLETVLFTHIFV